MMVQVALPTLQSANADVSSITAQHDILAWVPIFCVKEYSLKLKASVPILKIRNYISEK